jgi:polar amino acid transport system substrate-binding protein
MTFGAGIALRNTSPRCRAAQAGLCALVISAFAGAAPATQAEPATPLRVAVYDLEPYGGQSRDGLFNGASVELWRRLAEDRNWQYQLTLVPRMDDLLSGLQANAYDVAIGAITITPERLTRVDFSYPTHRSGVAAVFAKQTDATSALYEYGAAVSELGPLLVATAIFLTATGVLMWWFERSPAHSAGKRIPTPRSCRGTRASTGPWSP